MTDLRTGGADVLQGFLDAMSPDERDQLDVMERVKARVLRTDDRDGAVDKAFAALRRDLVTRIDPMQPIGPGNRSETRALVLTGNSGAGKSSIISRTLSAIPMFHGYGTPGAGRPAISVLTPAPCNPKALGLELCRRLGYPLTAERSLPYVWATARDRLELLNIAVLHLDEIHNVLATANERELTQLRTMLKTFLASPDWPVVLLLTGLTEVIPFLEGPAELDEHGKPRPDTKGELRRRCLFVHLPSLNLPDDVAMVAAALADMADVAGLSLPSDVEHAVVPRLVHAGLYELGTTIQIAQDAIAQALEVRSGGLLGREHFRLAYKLRTGAHDETNPFVVADWRKVDCRQVLKRDRDAAAAAHFASATR